MQASLFALFVASIASSYAALIAPLIVTVAPVTLICPLDVTPRSGGSISQTESGPTMPGDGTWAVWGLLPLFSALCIQTSSPS